MKLYTQYNVSMIDLSYGRSYSQVYIETERGREGGEEREYKVTLDMFSISSLLNHVMSGLPFQPYRLGALSTILYYTTV